MFPPGNKAKPVSSVSHTRKGIHHHRIRQIIRFESIFYIWTKNEGWYISVKGLKSPFYQRVMQFCQ